MMMPEETRQPCVTASTHASSRELRSSAPESLQASSSPFAPRSGALEMMMPEETLEQKIEALAKKHGSTQSHMAAAPGVQGARDWSGFLNFIKELIPLILPFIP